jgi:hypothetical protein
VSRQIPKIFNAGDTLQFSASFTSVNSAYTPGNGYSLEYYVRGECNFTATGSANGADNGWVVNFPPTATENVPGGLYSYIARVKKNADVFTVDQGNITVKPNLETAEADTQVEHVQRVLSAIADAIEGRITDDVQQFSIAGRSLVHIPAMELLEIQSRYMRRLKKLQLGPNRRLAAVQTHFDERA